MLNGFCESSRSHCATSLARWSKYAVPLMNCGLEMSNPIFFSGVPCQVYLQTWPSRLRNGACMSSLETRYLDRASAS